MLEYVLKAHTQHNINRKNGEVIFKADNKTQNESKKESIITHMSVK